MRVLKAIVLIVALFIILSLATEVRSQGHADVARVVDSMIDNVKSSAIHSSEINWNDLANDIRFAASQSKSETELRRSFETLLAGLKDPGAQFYNPATKSIIATSGPIRITTKTEQEFFFSKLDNNICYLRLTAIASGKSAQQQATLIRHAIDSLANEDAMQWIVDLRYTTDGDHQALLASIAPLFEEGLIATAVDNGKKIQNMYTVHNGNLYVDQIPVMKFPLFKDDLRKARIAVLTSRHTSGAAELVSLGLKGRKNTRLFGEPTAGNSFIMKDLEITKNISLRLAVLRFIDRKGNDYSEQIFPDVKIDFTANENIQHDAAIAAASSWLTSLPETPIAIGMNKKTL